MCFTALRPDRQWRIVSFPYYCKYATPADSNYFQHIDLNIPKAVDYGRGLNLVPGSVSLDKEDDKNATVVIKGFHQHIHAWW